MRTRLTALLLLLALALPAASLAQSAGDDQYVDPFQGEQGGGIRVELRQARDDGGGMPLGVALGGTAVLAAGLVAGGIVLKRRRRPARRRHPTERHSFRKSSVQAVADPRVQRAHPPRRPRAMPSSRGVRRVHQQPGVEVLRLLGRQLPRHGVGLAPPAGAGQQEALGQQRPLIGVQAPRAPQVVPDVGEPLRATGLPGRIARALRSPPPAGRPRAARTPARRRPPPRRP